MADRAPGLVATLSPWFVHLGRRRGRLLTGAALMLLALVAALGLLALSGWFITATALTGLVLASGGAAMLDVYVPGGGIRAFALTRTVARYLERLYNHDTVLRLLADLRGHMFAVLADLDAARLSRRRASDWLNRLTADIDTLDSLFLRLLAPALVALLAILGLSAFLALWAPSVGLATGVMLGLIWCWLTLGQARLGLAASRRRVTELERLRGRVIEHLSGMAELESHGALPEQRRRLDTIEARLRDDQRRLGRLSALGTALAGLTVGLTWVLALWLGAQLWASEALSGPLMVMMPLAVLAMSEALMALPMAFTQFGATQAAAERLNALEASRRPTKTLPDGHLPSAGPLSVDLERIGLRYPGALTATLDDFSLHLAPGERLALCGPSGVGKSSVAALIAGQLVPDSGCVRLGGVDIEHAEGQALRRRLAMLTQGSELFDDSLAANLRLGDPAASDEYLWRLLDDVELGEWARTLPRGLETRVGEGGRRLSGGQARRLALARLMLRDPGLVILDEPFTGLDAGTARRLAERLDAWLADRTVIYLSHRRDDEAMPLPGVTQTLELQARTGRPLCAKARNLSG
ncbi:thiol reductant ABC exporter subunit CydC [Halomonas caseinilytica]|uniref:thiol reductant ABC exporter subunit CydC n=1 Tax=Halomonas caseinilytica TaxID=438744 RepID=UPI0007E5494D|nr:thiol reductant ABC exporter subunit CydC [Halomonas caseinilytica]SEM26342.1 ATP-binding cassette, subfamily C, CydC [Halomonas caseinilytica]